MVVVTSSVSLSHLQPEKERSPNAAAKPESSKTPLPCSAPEVSCCYALTLAPKVSCYSRTCLEAFFDVYSM